MPTSRTFPLHENLLGGSDSTLPAHLLKGDQWHTQHNMRLVPTLKQVPHKVALALSLSLDEDVRWLGVIPGSTPGYGDAIALTQTHLFQKSTSAWNEKATLNDDGQYRRWSTALYDGRLYFVNDLNVLSVYANGSVSQIANAPAGRYLCFWYDHIVIGAPTNKPNQFQICHLYDFTDWTPKPTNEADAYDIVEWQQTDYPFAGVTGVGKLRGTLFVYTPTAIIPVQYVGLPKVIRVADEAVVTRTGNTFPWTLVCLDTVHFYYDAIEAMFFAFDGQTVVPIGEPVRQFMLDNLNEDITHAQNMYGYIDANYREIWWPFCSTASTGKFDKAVVFNYRYKKWFTASVENVQCFCSGSRTTSAVETLIGTIEALGATLVEQLGLDAVGLDRTFGTDGGLLLREEVASDEVASFVTPYDNPVLETPDFHYGDIRTVKEIDAMILNSTAPEIEVRIAGRDYLGTVPTFTVDPNKVWTPTLPDAMVNLRALSGRILRYRFTLKSSRLATFDAFSEGLHQKLAEK